MTYVYIDIHYLNGSDMINKLLIQKEGNEEAIESLIQTLAKLALEPGKKFTQKYLKEYKKYIRYTKIPQDKAQEFYQNPLFKCVFEEGSTDTFLFLLLDGVLKTITTDNITNENMLGKYLKYPEWKNICDNVNVLFDY